MAGEACVLIPNVKSKTNENGDGTSPSKLFKDLLHYSNNNRKFAKAAWAVSQSEKFRADHKDFKLDENGEPLFSELKKVAFDNFKEYTTYENLQETLNKDLNKGYDGNSYRDGIRRVAEFNRTNPFSGMNDKSEPFIATIQEDERGGFTLQIVPNTQRNRDKLISFVGHRNLQERLIARLNSLGVSVNFLRNPEFNGRYSTENAEQTANGFWELVSVAMGERGDTALAEEAGHFAIGALGNHPLVIRLQQLLDNEELRNEILNGPGGLKVMDDSPRELAGALVGNMLRGDADIDSPIFKSARRLGARILNIWKNIIKKHNFHAYRIQKDKIAALKIADKIATGFMSSDFTGDVDTALETKETLFDSTLKNNVVVFNKISNQLNDMAASMKNISSKLFQSYGSLAAAPQLGRRSYTQIDTISSAVAADGIAQSLLYLSQQSSALLDKMQETQDLIENISDFSFDQRKIARNLREVGTFLKYTANIIKFLDMYQNELVFNANSEGKMSVDGQYVSPKELTSRLRELTQNLVGEFTKQKTVFYGKFLAEVNGSDKIVMKSRIIFNHWKLKRTNNGKDKEYSMDDLIQSLDEDLDVMQRWLMSIQDSDVITQLHMKAINQANRMADDSVINTQYELMKLQSELKKINGSDNTAKFIEISPRTGRPTGNIISLIKDKNGEMHSYVWGDWEEDYNNWKKGYKKQWFKDHEQEIAGQADIVKSAYYFADFNEACKEWHKLHSQYDSKRRLYIPSKAYSSDNYTAFNSEYPAINKDYAKQFKDSQYNSLSEKEKDWLYKYIELKRKLDRNVPVGSTTLFRLPQVRAQAVNQIKNKLRFDNKNIFTATASTIHEHFTNATMESQFDTDFGSDNTYNSIDEDPFADSFYIKSKVGNRLPLYFINKITKKEEIKDANGKPLYDKDGKIQYREVFDIDNVSTDLFHSTLAYADMAYHYNGLSKIVDAFELARDILLDRDIKSTGKSKTYTANAEIKTVDATTGMSESDRISTLGESRAYARFKDMMEKNLYNINIPKQEGPFRFVLNKIANSVTKIGAALLLGGHPVGGVVNLNTGLIEIYKEGLTGDYFTSKEYAKAESLFLLDAAVNIGQGILMPVTGANVGIGRMTYVKTDKVSLFERFMNAREDNRVKAQHWYTRKSFIKHLNPFGDMLYMPYSAGDRNMQVVPYMAQAMHTKLYAVDYKSDELKRTTLWDALKVKNVVDSNGKVISKQLVLDESKMLIPEPEVPDKNPKTGSPYTKEEAKQYKEEKIQETAAEVKALSAILNKIAELKKTKNITLRDINSKLTDDEKKFLEKRKLSIEREAVITNDEGDKVIGKVFNRRLVYQIQNKINNLTFSENNKADFMEKCRQINNRLHGVYDESNKTGFQRTILGNMITTMKGYVLGYITRKFARNHYSVALGKDVEGSTVTYLKALLSVFQPIDEHEKGKTISEKMWYGTKTLSKQFIKAFAYTFFPYSKTCKTWLKEYGFSDEQVMNVKRSANDTYMMLLMTALRLFLRGAIKALCGGDDDDDKDKYKWFDPEGYGAKLINELVGDKDVERQKIINDPNLSDEEKNKALNELAKEQAMANMNSDGSFKSDNMNRAKYILALSYYFVTRASLEQSAYSNYFFGGQGWSELNNVIGLMPASVSGMFDCFGLISLMATGERYVKNPHVKKTHYKLTKDGEPISSEGVAQTVGDKYDDIIKAQGDDYFGLAKYVPWVGYRAVDAPKWKVKMMRRTPWLRVSALASDPVKEAESYDYNKYGVGQSRGSSGDIQTLYQKIFDKTDADEADIEKEEKKKKEKAEKKEVYLDDLIK